MMSLITEAVHEFDRGKRIFMADREVLLWWVDVLEQMKANIHA